jgi:4-carboxymuconolactone decarboxylase
MATQNGISIKQIDGSSGNREIGSARGIVFADIRPPRRQSKFYPIRAERACVAHAALGWSMQASPQGVRHMSDLFDKGLEIRRAVLGSDYVDKSLASADDFNRPMQELTTEFCWGNVWGRPGLERKTRSMLNLAMLSALNRPHELKLHVKGAIRNGVSKEEMTEIFLQAAVYCGVPVGIDSFRVAREAFKEMESE